MDIEKCLKTFEKYDYLLFDFDGTVEDTGEGIITASKYALEHFGINETRQEALDLFVGPPLDTVFPRYGFNTEQVLEAVLVFREYYWSEGWKSSYTYPGIKELLQRLKDAGKHLLIATGKPEPLVERIGNRDDILHYFEFMCGSYFEDGVGEVRTKKREVIKYIFEHFPIPEDKRSKTIMIGDRYSDIKGAQETGIDSCGVLWGYGTYEELSEAGATYII